MENSAKIKYIKSTKGLLKISTVLLDLKKSETINQ